MMERTGMKHKRPVDRAFEARRMPCIDGQEMFVLPLETGGVVIRISSEQRPKTVMPKLIFLDMRCKELETELKTVVHVGKDRGCSW